MNIVIEENCVWVNEYDDGEWRTNCGGRVVMYDGTPSDCGMKYCCYCGKGLYESVKKEEDGCAEGVKNGLEAN